MAANHPIWGLFCCICFRRLTPEECAQDSEGVKWDVCKGICATEAGLVQSKTTTSRE